MRNGFGRNLDFQDIYNHVTSPDEVYLLRNGDIKAMASYNRRVFADTPSLVVEGIAMDSSVQGKGVFGEITQNVVNSESVICLRTQNPRMYRALQKFRDKIHPRQRRTSENPFYLAFDFADNTFCKELIGEFANYLNCKIDDKGVIRGYYRGLFYGEEPTHCEVSKFFKDDLKMDLSKGDAVLAMGYNLL